MQRNNIYLKNNLFGCTIPKCRNAVQIRNTLLIQSTCAPNPIFHPNIYAFFNKPCPIFYFTEARREHVTNLANHSSRPTRSKTQHKHIVRKLLSPNQVFHKLYGLSPPHPQKKQSAHRIYNTDITLHYTNPSSTFISQPARNKQTNKQFEPHKTESHLAAKHHYCTTYIPTCIIHASPKTAFAVLPTMWFLASDA